MSDTARYATFDMGLAAGLNTAGFGIHELDKADPRKVEFIFEAERDDDELLGAIRNYWDGKLEVSALDYFNNLKMLKSRIYSS